MKRQILFIWLILLIFSGTNLTAQKIYRDGYVIKKTGETLNGLVEFAMKQEVPALCSFKRFDIATVVKYKPEDIMAFGYAGGNRYESKNLDGKVAFYEVLVSGRITLYQKDSKYYLDKDHLGIIALKEGALTYKGVSGVSEFNSLQEFLKYITEEKAGSIPEKPDLRKEIEPIITAYNKNSGNPYNIPNRQLSEKQLSQKALESGQNKGSFGIVAGANLYMLNLNPTGPVAVPTPVPELASIFGLSYERLLTRKTDRLSVRAELLYLRQTFYIYEEKPISSGGTKRDDIFFNFRGIKLPVMLQYSLTGKRIIPYFNAGVAFNLLLQKDYFRIEEIERPNNEVFTTEYRDYGMLPYEVSGSAGFGIRSRMKNNFILNIQGRVEYGTGIISPTQYFERLFKQNSIQANLLIGLTF